MSMYDGILEIGADGQVIEPVLVLSSRGGNKIGIIRNITGIQQTHPLSDVAELSFDVHKEMNGEVYQDWDKLKDFRFVQIPRTNDWFEATISLDDEDEMVKHVTCIHANEAELGQLNLYEVEIMRMTQGLRYYTESLETKHRIIRYITLTKHLLNYLDSFLLMVYPFKMRLTKWHRNATAYLYTENGTKTMENITGRLVFMI